MVDNAIKHLLNVKEAKTTWQILRSIYEIVNKTRVLYLKNMMYATKMEENGKIQN